MKKGSKWIIIALAVLGLAVPVKAQEVVVLAGLDETIAWLESENWLGQKKGGQPLKVPRALIVAIPKTWQKNALTLPVATKKEIFYRFMLPLVVHANTMVLDRRDRLKQLEKRVAGGSPPAPEDLAWLQDIAVILRISDRQKAEQLSEPDQLQEVIHQALHKLDVIPPGLVLGQAAYESGYGTSRFAVEGNALFGQWTFGGQGLIPAQQRKQLGDHRIASYEWPFDSVRAYFINLSSNPAYKDFRRLRADLKRAGKRVTSIALADGLKKYSERGQAYVDTLKSIIRVNRLDTADDAVFRNESMRFVLGASDPASAAKLRKDVKAMRTSGEFKTLVDRMRLE